MRCLRALLVLAAFSVASPAFGWIYPEHRDIAVLAVLGLDPERRAQFDRLWEDARIGAEARLCARGADNQQGTSPSCIDWAALPGIAGDHSCSSREMLDTVRSADWILRVAGVAAQLKVDLAGIPVTAPPDMTQDDATLLAEARRRLTSETNRAERLNALRTADNQMQRADPQYATRADANLAHFLLARPTTSLDPNEYALLALSPGSPLNAIGVYSWYHVSALRKAGRLAHETMGDEQRRTLTRSMLFDEAFALHFLEDSFASGHVAGSWGTISQRKGTHDFYNQNGLEVFTWRGRDRTIVLMGDAHMRPEDAALAASAVRTSLEQVLDTASGRSRGYALPHAPRARIEPDDFDICASKTFPDRGLGKPGDRPGPYAAPLEEALLVTPVPGLGAGLGARPRSRSEVGSFTGIAGAIDVRHVGGGFAPGQDDSGWIGGLDLGLRAGLGLEGALGDAGDGLVFAQVGFRADSPSSNKATGTALGSLTGSLSAAIPARSAVSARFRLPFYLVPGDLLLLSPMYFFAQETYTGMAVTAANGGLIPWQQGWRTPIGRFQFVLGREIGVTWYGQGGATQLAAPPATPGGITRVVNYKSVNFDFPILEYRPFRSFATNQSSTLLFQLFAGADSPYGESVEAPPGAPPVELQTVYSVGLRMVFDWRYYY